MVRTRRSSTVHGSAEMGDDEVIGGVVGHHGAGMAGSGGVVPGDAAHDETRAGFNQPRHEDPAERGRGELDLFDEIERQGEAYRG